MPFTTTCRWQFEIKLGFFCVFTLYYKCSSFTLLFIFFSLSHATTTTLPNSSGNETVVRRGVDLQINAGEANNLGNHRVDARDEEDTPGGALKERALSFRELGSRGRDAGDEYLTEPIGTASWQQQW